MFGLDDALLLGAGSLLAGGLGEALSGGEPDVRQIGGPSDRRIRALVNAQRRAYGADIAAQEARSNQQIVNRAAAQGTLGSGLINRDFQAVGRDRLAADLANEANLARLQAELYGAQQFGAYPTTRQRIGSALAGFGGKMGGAAITGGVLGSVYGQQPMPPPAMAQAASPLMPEPAFGAGERAEQWEDWPDWTPFGPDAAMEGSRFA